jgi:hypothetical protein
MKLFPGLANILHNKREMFASENAGGGMKP